MGLLNIDTRNQTSVVSRSRTMNFVQYRRPDMRSLIVNTTQFSVFSGASSSRPAGSWRTGLAFLVPVLRVYLAMAVSAAIATGQSYYGGLRGVVRRRRTSSRSIPAESSFHAAVILPSLTLLVAMLLIDS